MDMIEFANYCIKTGYRGRAINKARHECENTVIFEFRDDKLFNLNTGNEITFEAFFYDWHIELME